MKKIKITIPYNENKHKHILLALNVIKSHSDMSLEKLSVLTHKFHDMEDIFYIATTDNKNDLLSYLDLEGFIYEVSDEK